MGKHLVEEVTRIGGFVCPECSGRMLSHDDPHRRAEVRCKSCGFMASPITLPYNVRSVMYEEFLVDGNDNG